MSTAPSVEKAYELAKEQYAALGVNTDSAIEKLGNVAISLHCWQGDDVGGFETSEGLSGGGIQATGNYPGKARTADELRADLDKAMSLIPGKQRLNLHALYAETGNKRVERDKLQPEHFTNWVEWAKAKGIGLDFNPSYFSHPKADDGFTLSSRDEGIRKFWVDHGIACRKIGESFGKALGTTCVTNVWIPDGYKDIPVDRKTPREILKKSLDEMFAEAIDPKYNLDAVEGKLFGIGSESYVVGSNDFYLGYAKENNKLLCLDAEYGGFLTFLDRDGSVYGTDKPVWLQGRIVWMFSRLYNQVEKRQEWLDLARFGLDFLLKHCFDTDGRAFFLVERDGRPKRKRRYLFSEVFAIMGLAEFAKASGEDWARAKACEVWDLMLRYHTTPGLLEPKSLPGILPSKSQAMPMILLNTAQVIRQVDDRPIYTETIDNSIWEVFNHFYKPELKATLENVGPNGEFIDSPEGRSLLPGHTVETAWFMMEEGRYRGDEDLWRRSLQVLEWSLEAGWDEQSGGLLYYTDVKGKPCLQYEWDMKLWWPHTEALYATLLAHHLTGEEKWEKWYDKIHDYTFSHFPDPDFGEWFGYLHRDGTVSHRMKGNLWKAPYHLSRMQMYCWKLLTEMLATAS